MLPRVIQESQVRPFKFWFNESLQDGIHYQKELYYRLHTCDSGSRGKLYQVACRLARNGADVLITVAATDCSLWANLRNQQVAAITFSDRLKLPSAEKLLAVSPATSPATPNSAIAQD